MKTEFPPRLVSALRAMWPGVLRLLRRQGRWLLWLAGGVLTLLLAIGAAWQFWLIPHLEEYRPRLVAELTRAAGMPVEVGSIAGGWEGLRPELRLGEIRVLDRQGAPALQLARIEGALSWWALPLGKLHFSRIELVAPELTLTRQRDGRWRVGNLLLESSEQGDSEAGFFNWLLAQGGLSLAKGRLTLLDERTPDVPLTLRELNLQAGNLLGWRRVSFGFVPPTEIGEPVSGSGTLSGNDINRLVEWSGQLRFDLGRVDLARLDSRINALLPRNAAKWPLIQSGQGRLALTLAFAKQTLEKLDADLAIEQFRFSHGPRQFQLPLFDASFHWEAGASREQLQIEARRIVGSDGLLAQNGRFEYQHHDQERELLLRNFTLQGLNGYLGWLPEPAAGKLTGSRLAGDIALLRYGWRGDWQQPERWRGEIKATAVDIALPQLLPRLGKLDLSGKFSEQGGSAILSSTALDFVYPAQFIEPLHFTQLQSNLNWKRLKDASWELNVDKLALANADTALSVSAQWLSAGSPLGTLNLRGDIERALAARVYAYLPRVVHDETLAWLKHALQAGNAFHGKAVVQGELSRFPFADGGPGQFLITANAKDVTLDYGKGWPVLTGIDGELRFEGHSMTIKAARANTSGARLKEVLTRIPDLSHNQHVLVEGKAEGPSTAFLRFVHDSPVRQATQQFLDPARADGNGQLDLQLDIPISKPDAAKVQGRYRFGNQKIELGHGIPVLQQASADIEFSESGMKIHQASGRALGGNFKLTGSTDTQGVLKLALQGDARLSEATQQYGLPLAKRAVGSTAYQGEIIARRDRYELLLNSRLSGARIDLPAPFGKAANEVRPLRIKLAGGGQRQAIEFSYDQQLQGVLAQHGSQPYTGIINLGSALPSRVSARRGILLAGRLPELDLGQWSTLLDGGGADDASAIGALDLHFDRLSGWGKQLNQARIQGTPGAQGWNLQLSSQEAAGRFDWRGGALPKLSAQLERLAMPLPDAAGDVVVNAYVADQGVADNQPKPQLDLRVENFRYKDAALGQLTVDAVPQGDGWLLNKVALLNADANFHMSGLWQGRGATERTTARIRLTSDNAGKLLARLGYPDALKRAPTELSAEGSWHGSPFAPDYASLQGKLHLQVKAGQFAKIEPGAGRLLSVLSLQSLSRRVRLDFSDVFSEGLAFDSISGDALIQRGIARTDNLAIDGPAAKVRFKGEADIGAGTQNLRVKVTPLVGNAAALAVGVVNPIAGAAAFVVQQVLKDPLGQLISYEYDISGEWADPKVSKVK